MRTAALLAAAAALLAPGIAAAQTALRVEPLMVDVSSPAQASSVTLQNNGASELTLQLRVYEWSQVDGEDRLTPTDEVVASPPIARIAPGSNYTVRIARTVGAAASGTEKAYRLWLDELPPETALRDGGGEVGIRLRFDLPVFFHGTDDDANLTWSARREGPDVVLEAANTGRRHARIEGLQLQGRGGTSVSFGQGLNGYVLAGSTRRWTAPVGDAALAGGSATVVIGPGGNETRHAVALAN
jgi:fimbrial chaperone protein